MRTRSRNIQTLATVLMMLATLTSRAGAQDVIRTHQPSVAPPAEIANAAPNAHDPADDAPDLLEISGNRPARIDLPARFEPDPQRLELHGRTALEAQAMASQCRGYVSESPQLVMTYVATGLPLFLDVARGAATLLLEMPDGTIVCTRRNDGASSSQLTIPDPVSGQYRLWLVSRRADRSVSADLAISERGFRGSGLAVHSPTRSTDITLAEQIDPRGSAMLGTVDVRQLVQGPIRWSALLLPYSAISLRGQTSCSGFVESTPTLVLTAAVGQRVTLRTEGQLDTVIFARAPDGSWLCDDDGALGFNAGLELTIGSGEAWQVFVGSYQEAVGPVQTSLALQAWSMINPIDGK